MLDSCGPKSGELLEPDRQAPIHVDHCQSLDLCRLPIRWGPKPVELPPHQASKRPEP